MTLLVNRPIPGPKVHAFVLGVGDYPFAKPGIGVNPALQNVPDLPSAADSAKLMCNWLIAHQDELAAPLATLRVLISDPAIPQSRFNWTSGPVLPATEANVTAIGYQWFQDVIAEPGNIALFYCCGHGASHRDEPVLFLQDLNANGPNAWTHIDLGLLALTLRKSQTIQAAFLIIDACGQYVPEFELGKSQDSRFFDQPNLFAPSRNQVSLLCAAAEGQLAYEGPPKFGSQLNFGRFTQTLLKGLDGASARWFRNRWGVPCRDVHGDLKSLRRIFFDHWSEQPFEPYQAVTPADPLPIVYPTNFHFPLVVMTDPLERMSDYGLIISRRDVPEQPWLTCIQPGNSRAWNVSVAPSRDAHYAIAFQGTSHHPLLFQPKEPLFEQWIPVP